MNVRNWLVLTVRVAEPEAQVEVAEGLIDLGGSAVVQEDDRLSTYLVEPEEPTEFVNRAAAQLRARVPGVQLEIEWSLHGDEDWAQSWRRGLRPRRTGERLVVAPSWTEPELRPDDILIVVDPEMAFGTGEHATTRGALRALEVAVRPGDRVLDVGTGSGILAIAAALLGAKEVMAIESDPDAIENAQDNLRRNGVAERVDLIHGLVDDAFLAMLGPGRFDVIVANVLSGVLVPLLPAFHAALTPPRGDREGAGQLILGGILEEEADDVIDAASRAGFTLVAEDLEEEWWGGRFEADPVRGTRFG